MLVEDDNNLREIYEARMQAEGYDIVSAKDGEEALVIAKAEKPELIISDVMMPKISGFEMLDILRNTDGLKDVKVIMLTALGQADDQQRADRLGADRYLVKSQVTLEDIVNVAHQLLGDTPEPEPVLAATPVAPVAEPAPMVVAAPIVEPTPITPPPDAVAAVAEPSVAAPPIPAPTVTPAATPVEPVVTTTQPELVAPAVAEPNAPTTPQTSFSAVQVEPTDTSVSDPTPAAAIDDNGAQTTAQEEATVEAQIEDFVSGASSDAPPAVNASVPEPAAAASEPVVTIAEPSSTAEPTNAEQVTAADDKLMAEALDNLATNSLPEPASDATPLVPEPVATVPAPSPPQPTPEPPVVAGKKVITPLSNGEAKPDINTLLAEEEAKVILNQPPTPPAAVVMQALPTLQTPPGPTPADSRPDPSSISL